MNIALRPIIATDSSAIAALHAASWRATYRGVLDDGFLDRALYADRELLWQRRLQAPTAGQFGLIATAADEPVGFVFVFPHADRRWGTLIDNLHAHPNWRGRGIGRLLLAQAAGRLTAEAPAEPIFLWVFEANRSARRFYEALGAAQGERELVDAPGGGQVAHLRYSWTNAGSLLGALRPGAPIPFGKRPARSPDTSAPGSRST